MSQTLSLVRRQLFMGMDLHHQVGSHLSKGDLTCRVVSVPGSGSKTLQTKKATHTPPGKRPTTLYTRGYLPKARLIFQGENVTKHNPVLTCVQPKPNPGRVNAQKRSSNRLAETDPRPVNSKRQRAEWDLLTTPEAAETTQMH